MLYKMGVSIHAIKHMLSDYSYFVKKYILGIFYIYMPRYIKSHNNDSDITKLKYSVIIIIFLMILTLSHNFDF